MRWISFSPDGEPQTGLVIGDVVNTLPVGTTLLPLLGDDGESLHRAGEVAERDPESVLPLASLNLLPPIPNPPSIRDFYAFEDHARTGRRSRGQDLPAEWLMTPVFYFSNPASLVGHDAPVEAAPGSATMDYEVAAVIGLGGRSIAPAAARAASWGCRKLMAPSASHGCAPATAPR